MKERRYNIFDEINDLYVDVYLIGYDNEGESCIFVLRSSSQIFYTLVIDSYKVNDNNLTLDILNKIDEKRKLDMLIWTHPHDDHSIGMEDIIHKKCDNNTKIITANILNNSNRYSKISNSVIECISNKINGRKNNQRWDVNPMAHFIELIQQVNFERGKKLIKLMKIRCIAPYPNVGAVQGLLKEENINKLSIGVLVEIMNEEGVINLLFTGDMEKQTIDAIYKEQQYEDIPDTYNYIKIPHHGSVDPINLTKLLNMDIKSGVGCTTVFRKQNLPDKNAINTYSNYIESIHCTADINNDNFGHGVIKVSYDIKNKKRVINYCGVATEVSNCL